ncbi:hypothetical protein T06_10310 [Trichinella sp. T6]|nr:hypothetical protein T06_10310 [Trichinella sp. T6]
MHIISSYAKPADLMNYTSICETDSLKIMSVGHFWQKTFGIWHLIHPLCHNVHLPASVFTSATDTEYL